MSVDSQATPAGEVVFSAGAATQFLFNAGGNRTGEVTITNRFPGGPDILTVNKVVTGQVPAGTLFIIRVQCNTDLDNTTPGLQITKFLLFGETGGSQDVRVAQGPGAACTVDGDGEWRGDLADLPGQLAHPARRHRPSRSRTRAVSPRSPGRWWATPTGTRLRSR